MTLKLIKTCWGCPEQYEVYTPEGKQVGYLRLRHGYFRVDYPDCGGEVIYEAEPKGDGIFEDEERGFYLGEAVRAIKNRMAGGEVEPEYIIIDKSDE